MTSMASDRLAAVAPGNAQSMSPPASVSRALPHPDARHETSSNPTTTSSGGFAVPPPPALSSVAPESRGLPDTHYKTQSSQLLSTDDRFSQSDPRSAEGSQASNATSSSTDHVFTPTASDSSTNPLPPTGSSQDSQLLHLSAVAAAQDRMTTMADGNDVGASRKRMADGEVKSPGKGHSRNTSTVSMASNASTIGEVWNLFGWARLQTNNFKLSSELRTRLSYAMVKVNHGWQGHSLQEVESLASHAVSPTSSNSTAVHRRSNSSASPQLSGRVHFAQDPIYQQRKSNSPPTAGNRPALAPPAPIRPSIGNGASSSHPRRNSNPHYTPTLLSNSHSASPRTPAQLGPLNTSQPRTQGPDSMLYSPHQNVREVRKQEQDAIESLLFMSSPNNSANLKHSFSPTGSPGPSSQGQNFHPLPPSSSARQPLPGSPRKALPSQRPAAPAKRVGFETTSGMPPPDSPMDLDSPQQAHHSPNRGTPRRRMNGGGAHLRSALSLPSALGIRHIPQREPISDKDIDRMLDRADEANNSSDDEDIPLPPRRTGFTGPIGA